MVGPTSLMKVSGKATVVTWRCVKQLLQGRLLSPDYQQIFYNQFEQYRQSMRTMTTYMEEFHHLTSRCDLSLTEEQHTAKYIHRLKYSIQERVDLQDVYSVDEAQNKAKKVVRLQNNILSFKDTTERTSGNTRTQKGLHQASGLSPRRPLT